ncbi:hypothetical protein Trydic_g6661 [Trypoxylus dichotomus]
MASLGSTLNRISCSLDSTSDKTSCSASSTLDSQIVNSNDDDSENGSILNGYHMPLEIIEEILRKLTPEDWLTARLTQHSNDVLPFHLCYRILFSLLKILRERNKRKTMCSGKVHQDCARSDDVSSDEDDSSDEDPSCYEDDVLFIL